MKVRGYVYGRVYYAQVVTVDEWGEWVRVCLNSKTTYVDERIFVAFLTSNLVIFIHQ